MLKRKTKKERFFPFSRLRPGQKEFFYDVWNVLEEGKNLVAHAPTGIGKTVAALAPSVHYGFENNKKIFFLTSKQSQHTIAIETLKRIEEVSGYSIRVCDIISKQSMCPREIAGYHPLLFHYICNLDSATKKCPYLKTKNHESVDEILERIYHVEEAKDICYDHHVCPHATLLKAARKAEVVVCDYNYFFSELKERVMERVGSSLEDCIVIVDEAHNLPERIRAQLSDSLTLNRLKEAILEVKKVDGQIERHLKFIKEGVEKIIKEKEREIKEGKEEFNISKSELVKLVNRSLKQSIVGQMGYFDFVDRLLKIGTQLSEEITGESPVLKLGKFLEGWLKAGESSSRILSLKEPASISFNLLDPAIISTPVFSSVHASVVMSGTLYPPEMFKDILGISEAVCRAYPSPFPKENKKVIVTEGVTSKYKERRREMYQKIAENISNIANEIFENVAVFFPSYSFMMNVYEHYPQSPYWDIYLEKRGMSKKEKELLYKQLFKDIKTKRCMLWGVQAGSLSEGVDYEKNVLKAVIVVGLPLSPPSLDVKNLVAYYSKKFGKRKGHLYGYIYPALAKVIQSAGRGIRSEKDYGIIVLMDYRFKYPTYRKYFPDDFHIVVTDDPVRECREFFKRFKDRGRGN